VRRGSSGEWKSRRGWAAAALGALFIIAGCAGAGTAPRAGNAEPFLAAGSEPPWSEHGGGLELRDDDEAGPPEASAPRMRGVPEEPRPRSEQRRRPAGESLPDGVAATLPEAAPAKHAEAAVLEEAELEIGPGPEASPRAALQDYLSRLRGAPRTAATAYRQLWEVRPDVIPLLIPHVTSTERTELRELDLLVLQKDFARYDEADRRFYYNIRGMGQIHFDDIAVGPARSGRGRKVVLKDFGGFPLGVVIRAALLNRFRSSDFPEAASERDLRGWWQAFYEKLARRRME
jgi:hypothetical protein